MRVLVMGAGAIGGVFGGFLRRAGHEVAMVGRPGHMEAIAREGLRISGRGGNYQIEGLRTFETVGQVGGEVFEVVFLSVKSYDVEQAMKEIVAAGLRRDPLVVSLQKGLGNVETIARHVGPERAAGGRVDSCVEIVGPGHCRVTVRPKEVMLGELEPDAIFLPETVEALAELVSKAGIPTRRTDRIHTYLWDHCLDGCLLNPTATLLGTECGQLAEHEETRDVLRRVAEEVYAVAAACRIELLVPTASDYIERLFDRLARAPHDHPPPMLRDIQAGRRTEIDAMNGMIVRRGLEVGIGAPTNQLLTMMIKALERSRLGAQ